MRLRTFLLIVFGYLFVTTTPIWALDADVQEYLRDKLDKALDIRLFVSPPTEKQVIELGYPVMGNVIVGDAQFACAHDGDACGCINLPLSLQDISVDELITLVDNEPLTTEEQAACDMMAPKWKVAQSRYGPTRPLYQINEDPEDTRKISIGRAPVGTECGALIKDSYRGMEYRTVTLGEESEPLPEGLLALYEFDEGEGVTVHDVSGIGAPLNLTINDPDTATWMDDGSISIASPSTIMSIDPATKVTDGVKDTNELTIEAWVKPDSLESKGPARIVTISVDPGERNFTLGQQLTQYVVRFRTSETGGNGTPSLDSVNDTVTQELTHVVYTRKADGNASLYINGILSASYERLGDITMWNGTWHLTLANEATDDRPWVGSMYRVALYNRALTEAEITTRFSDNPTEPPEDVLIGYSLCEKVLN